MATEVAKLKELDYNTTITLGVVEQDADLKAIFTDEIRLPSGSLFDFFNYRASSITKLIFYVTSAVLVSALQPVLWLFGLSDHITSESDFFAWPLIAGSLLFSIKKRR